MHGGGRLRDCACLARLGLRARLGLLLARARRVEAHDHVELGLCIGVGLVGARTVGRRWAYKEDAKDRSWADEEDTEGGRWADKQQLSKKPLAEGQMTLPAGYFFAHLGCASMFAQHSLIEPGAQHVPCTPARLQSTLSAHWSEGAAGQKSVESCCSTVRFQGESHSMGTVGPASFV